MPKRATPMSAHEIRAKPPGLWADGRGLYLHVTPTDARSWIFRYSFDGKRRDMGLGPIEDVSLKLARENIGELRLMVRDGIDPIEAKRSRAAERRAKRNQSTFAECADAYIEANRGGWKSAKSET